MMNHNSANKGAINLQKWRDEFKKGAINLQKGRDEFKKGAINRAPTGFAGEMNPMLQMNLARIIRWYKGRTTFECRKKQHR